MISLDRAIEIATEAHRTQRDKGNKPYILHPLRVMLKVINQGENYAIVGVLHDVVEDNPDKFPLVSFQPLLPEQEYDALDRLTKHEGETRRDNYVRVKLNPIATAIKIADLEDNMNITRLKNGKDLQVKDLDRINDYAYGWHYLSGR